MSDQPSTTAAADAPVTSSYDMGVYGNGAGVNYSCRRVVKEAEAPNNIISINPHSPPVEGEFGAVYRWTQPNDDQWQWVSDHPTYADARAEAVRLAGSFVVKLFDFGVSPYSGNRYTPESCEKALAAYQERIALGTARCELGMPLPSRTDKLSIDEMKVCAKITAIHVDAIGVIGRFEPTGPLAAGLMDILENNIPYRFAMRALTRRSGPDDTTEIDSIISFDFVNG